MSMRSCLVISFALAVAAAACGRPATREFTFQGQVISVMADHREAVIKHEDIPGFMPAMTMPYKVRDPRQFEGLVPGDLINAKLVVLRNDAYLTDVKKVGTAPLAKADAPPGAAAAAAALDVLQPGDAVPDAHFVDQDGRKVDFAAFKGHTVLLTFIYTRCPLPTFCPLMDRHFASIQQTIARDPAMKGRVHLVTVSFDPATDTPAVLKKHAQSLGADLRTWSFLTGDLAEIDRFSSRFGVVVTREGKDGSEITHTLRTAIIDPGGRVVKVYVGNDWTPAQALADLKPVATSSR
ncbi:MAG: SCO family protein [Betaproteobacteria bacterium]